MQTPKSGWECLRVYDSMEDDPGGELYFTCEMCTTKIIRYVHVMEHILWPEPVRSGCICAGYMEGNRERAQEREAKARREARFPDHKNWRRTANGNLRLRVAGSFLCVYRQGARGRVWGENVDSAEAKGWGKGDHDTERDAQKAAFRLLMHLKGQAVP